MRRLENWEDKNWRRKGKILKGERDLGSPKDQDTQGAQIVTLSVSKTINDVKSETFSVFDVGWEETQGNVGCVRNYHPFRKN